MIVIVGDIVILLCLVKNLKDYKVSYDKVFYCKKVNINFIYLIIFLKIKLIIVIL